MYSIKDLKCCQKPKSLVVIVRPERASANYLLPSAEST